MSFCASEAGGICSANCPVCVSRPLDHHRELREPQTTCTGRNFVKSYRTVCDIFLSAIFLSAMSILCSLTPCAVSAQTQEADYQTAVSFVQQGQFDRAFPILQRILDRSPTDLKALNLMGIALSAAGRREEANEHFKKVLALEPKFVPALKNMALN